MYLGAAIGVINVEDKITIKYVDKIDIKQNNNSWSFSIFLFFLIKKKIEIKKNIIPKKTEPKKTLK